MMVMMTMMILPYPHPPSQVQSINCDVLSIALQMTCVWSRSSLAVFDAARAAEPPPPGCLPYWNLVWVDAISNVRVRATPEGGGTPHVSDTRRQGVFVFARGPLPRRVVAEVHAPWWLVGWV